MAVLRSILVVVLSVVIATTALGVDTNGPPNEVPPQQAVDLTRARAHVKAKNWQAALDELVTITETATNADAFNLMAFSLRNLGHHDAAFIYYFKAIELDSAHKGAREYLGELYAKLGDFAKAEEQRAILSRLCPSGCEELDDLETAIATARSAKR